MKNPLRLFRLRRRTIEPITMADVEAAKPPDPEKEEDIKNLARAFYRNVLFISQSSADIRDELANDALILVRGRRR